MDEYDNARPFVYDELAAAPKLVQEVQEKLTLLGIEVPESLEDHLAADPKLSLSYTEEGTVACLSDREAATKSAASPPARKLPSLRSKLPAGARPAVREALGSAAQSAQPAKPRRDLRNALAAGVRRQVCRLHLCADFDIAVGVYLQRKPDSLRHKQRPREHACHLDERA